MYLGISMARGSISIHILSLHLKYVLCNLHYLFIYFFFVFTSHHHILPVYPSSKEIIPENCVCRKSRRKIEEKKLKKKKSFTESFYHYRKKIEIFICLRWTLFIVRHYFSTSFIFKMQILTITSCKLKIQNKHFNYIS